ncbi:MAG: histidine kinase [Roseovarius sp. BRH_c41]|nr:MAG: histidine kinase [Roseovarius sp. BRH_c41]
MANMRRYLPSLGSFATFEVAAKHLSFTLAANELNVTPAAISQQIRGLEKALGVALFKRLHNALELTGDGQRILSAVVAGLDGLCDAIAEVRQQDSVETITVSGTTASMALWLTPFVERFQAAHPDVSFVLLASDENDRLRNFDDVDVSIICGNERCEVGETLYYMFAEVTEPMCSAGFLERFGPITAPEDLHRVELLDLHPMHWHSEAIGWFPLSWGDWFRAQGCPPPSRPYSIASNNYPLLVDAAIAGRGAVLGWHHLMRDHVSTGRLQPIFDAPLQIDRGYYAKVNAISADRPYVREFLEMILAESEAMPRIERLRSSG